MSEAEIKEQTFTKKVLITAGIAILFSVALVLAYFAVDVIFSLFAAILLAVFFRGLGDLVSRSTKISEGVSLLLVCVGLGGIIGGAIWVLAPDIVEQLKQLREVFPQTLNTLSQRISEYSWGQLIVEQIPAWQQVSERFASSGFLTRVGGVFSTTLGIFANLIVIILMAIYLAGDPEPYTKGLIKLFPVSRRPRIGEVIGEISETLRWWLVGKFVSMLIIGILTTIGLSLLGIPLALTFGIIAGLLAFIPNFGPIIAVTPAALLGLAESPVTALYVLALYLGIQMVESYLITPMINRETVSLPPVLTIFFQMFLGVLVGGLGLILATPLLAAIVVIVKMLYIEDVLGDEISVPRVDKDEDLAERD
jgi:predicted PurR-regulated permease PerM